MSSTSPAATHVGSIEIVGPEVPRAAEILTPEALDFVGRITARFAGSRDEVLRARLERYRSDHPRALGFLDETRSVRDDADWRVAAPAPGLVDRRAEITGPPSRKMTINALNSGARVWMADFEDATSPTWFNVVDGQVNLHDAIRGRIDFTDDRGKSYAVDAASTTTIVVRPRGWHLEEQHLLLEGVPVPGAFVDFGLFFFHNAQALLDSGVGPYFYLPKMESHREARLWNDVFTFAQADRGIPHGSIRATCLIETTPAAFEMEEILYELRDHSAGLNAGRWDYIFSMIKNFADDPGHLLPDRGQVTMLAPFMRAYALLLAKTCHRRGAHAIGGMAAFVPSRGNEAATTAALEKTASDKAREAGDGFDGSWVAHPALVQTCIDAFTAVLGDRPNQLERQRDDVEVDAAELTEVSSTEGSVTSAGVRTNLRVSLEYLAAWVGGQGAVAIDSLMEDAATVEISRMQIWQWIRHGATLEDGSTVSAELVRSLLDQEVTALTAGADEKAAVRFAAAEEILEATFLVDEWPAFFTNYAYEHYLVQRTV